MKAIKIRDGRHVIVDDEDSRYKLLSRIEAIQNAPFVPDWKRRSWKMKLEFCLELPSTRHLGVRREGLALNDGGVPLLRWKMGGSSRYPLLWPPQTLSL